MRLDLPFMQSGMKCATFLDGNAETVIRELGRAEPAGFRVTSVNSDHAALSCLTQVSPCKKVMRMEPGSTRRQAYAGRAISSGD